MTAYKTEKIIEGGLRNSLRRLAEVPKSPVIFTQKQLLRMDSLRKSMRSEYSFSYKDINLYTSEKFAQMKSMVVESTDDLDLVKITIGGKSIFWPKVIPAKTLPWLFHEIFDPFDDNPSSYDHPDLDFSNRAWVMDAGAAEGYFSLFSLERSVKKILCVEPLSIMRTALDKTLDLHAHSHDAIVVTSALGSVSGSTEMEIDYDSICDAFIQLESGSFKGNAGNLKVDEIERVSISTIDQLASEYDLGERGLIKMDIEGFEMEAMKGAKALLREHKPALAIAVYHALENANECARIIKSANPDYTIEFRGFYGYFNPPRPYMLFAT
ncbi:MAG: FkbM family methyltransferase [Cyanobacteria bacterium P01_F01_bin.53]